MCTVFAPAIAFGKGIVGDERDGFCDEGHEWASEPFASVEVAWPTMKSLILSSSDSLGGAARATLRLHQAMLDEGHDSHMLVRIRRSDIRNIETIPGAMAKATALLRPRVGKLISSLGHAADGSVYSGNWLPSNMSARAASARAEVVNIHWVGDEMLSIADIGRIRQPVVWTMHDMWAFCGCEHYAPDDTSARWRVGYSSSHVSGLDLDKSVWLRKRKHWQRPMHIIAPSRWLADCIRSSALFHDQPVACIPNPLDTNTFRPLDRAFSRDALGLPQDAFLVAFGAMGGAQDPRKGFDLLRGALERIATTQASMEIQALVFGQSAPRDGEVLPVAAHWLGHIHDDVTLALLYSAADVMVVPSRQENLPQTATEAQACGCPVLAFNCTGLPDAVEHGVTGYLARAYDVDDLVKGFVWLHQDEDRRSRLRLNARARAERLWSPATVLPQYLDIYELAKASSHPKRSA